MNPFLFLVARSLCMDVLVPPPGGVEEDRNLVLGTVEAFNKILFVVHQLLNR